MGHHMKGAGPADGQGGVQTTLRTVSAEFEGLEQLRVWRQGQD